jgi:uncharacterized protein YbjT (DUF2867 family)
MTINKVLLLGGSGFVGTSVAEQLSARGIFVTIPTRGLSRCKHLLLLPTVDVVEADIFDAAELEALVRQHDAVINLLGVLHGDFERVHVAFAKLVADTCAKAGVTRLIHMSALNADVNAPSEYLRSRGRGEAAVWSVCKSNPSLKVTMFRPSVIFGERDKFINLFAKLAKFFWVIPLGSAGAKFQPVWVEDVARAIVTSLDMAAAKGQTYPLVGPKVYTLRELVELVVAVTHRRCLIVGLGPALSMMQARVFGMLPGKLITSDNVRSMSIANISDQPYPVAFGSAAALEAVVPTYLGRETAAGRTRYKQFRHAAGR